MKDPKHLKALRGMPCATLRSRSSFEPIEYPSDAECLGPVEAHHPTGGGLALKKSDLEAFPLCLGHHSDRHDLRGLFRDWTKAELKTWERAMSDIYRPKKGDF